jgi:hypothetical protein
MKKIMSIATLGTIVAFAGIAVAGECPLLVKQLRDAKVTDQAKAGEVKKLTDECEQLHKDGKHADSVAKCNAAAKVAGIELKHKK